MILSVATPTGIEPVIFSVTGRHVNHYTTGPEFINLLNKQTIIIA